MGNNHTVQVQEQAGSTIVFYGEKQDVALGKEPQAIAEAVRRILDATIGLEGFDTKTYGINGNAYSVVTATICVKGQRLSATARGPFLEALAKAVIMAYLSRNRPNRKEATEKRKFVPLMSELTDMFRRGWKKLDARSGRFYQTTWNGRVVELRKVKGGRLKLQVVGSPEYWEGDGLDVLRECLDQISEHPEQFTP